MFLFIANFTKFKNFPKFIPQHAEAGNMNFCLNPPDSKMATNSQDFLLSM